MHLAPCLDRAHSSHFHIFTLASFRSQVVSYVVSSSESTTGCSSQNALISATDRIPYSTIFVVQKTATESCVTRNTYSDGTTKRRNETKTQQVFTKIIPSCHQNDEVDIYCHQADHGTKELSSSCPCCNVVSAPCSRGGQRRHILAIAIVIKEAVDIGRDARRDDHHRG